MGLSDRLGAVHVSLVSLVGQLLFAPVLLVHIVIMLQLQHNHSRMRRRKFGLTNYVASSICAGAVPDSGATHCLFCVLYGAQRHHAALG